MRTAGNLDLHACIGGGFESKIGSKGENSPEHLRYALWTASQQLQQGASSSKAAKRILIFTRDVNPPGQDNPTSRCLFSEASLLVSCRAQIFLTRRQYWNIKAQNRCFTTSWWHSRVLHC